MQLRTSFPPVAASAGDARRLVRGALAEWGLSAAEEETALLLLTELMSNGVRHAKTELHVLVTYDGFRIHVGVSDGDQHPAALTEATPTPHRGWGLRLVDLLSSDWGTITERHGKTVWFDLDVAERPGLVRA
jgi:anti-sigma regulatory factor (Ser/Thr protein kinase)